MNVYPNGLPGLPLPQPIRGNVPGTWAHSTITRRLPEIASRVVEENDFPSGVQQALELLIDELPFGPIRLLKDRNAPESREWDGYVRPYLGMNWMEIPWFFAEAYFYRRILEATGYFGPGPASSYDPFAYQKNKGLSESAPRWRSIIRLLGEWQAGEGSNAVFAHLVVADLWGNQADLSLWPAGADEDTSHESQAIPANRNLLDQTAQLLRYCSSIEAAEARFTVVSDNAGLEFMIDLLAAAYLLEREAVSEICFYLKPHPTFVSDATPRDFKLTLEALQMDIEPDARMWGERIEAWMETGKFRVLEDPFWTSPLPGWEMPGPLRSELGGSDLVVIKGDMNYRRLLGDRSWPPTAPFDKIVRYFPAPLLALRVLKAELVTDLEPERIASLNQQDPDWMTDGRWGTIQFSIP